jgi:5-bromo-4-chloroindolyl phosphate hydrolysis protein
MSDTTDIEKKSLEAHVELCAERYRFLEEKLENVESKISAVNITLTQVRSMMEAMSEKHTDRILNWGVAVIGVLTSIIAFLLVQYVFK